MQTFTCPSCGLTHQSERIVLPFYHECAGALRVDSDASLVTGEGEPVMPSPAVLIPPVLEALPHGPGTELAKILRELGLPESQCLGCLGRIVQMNEWGVEGCREHRDEIVGWLQEGFANTDWKTRVTAAAKAFQTGLAFEVNWLDPFSDFVDEAIRRADASFSSH